MSTLAATLFPFAWNRPQSAPSIHVPSQLRTCRHADGVRADRRSEPSRFARPEKRDGIFASRQMAESA